MGYQSNQRKPKPHQQKSRIQSRMAKCPVWLPCPIRSVTFVQTALWTEFPFIGEDFPNWNRSSPNRNLRFPKWNPISANGSTVPKSTRSKCPGRTLISSCSGGKSYFEHLATHFCVGPFMVKILQYTACSLRAVRAWLILLYIWSSAQCLVYAVPLKR